MFQLIKPGTHIDFLGHIKKFYILSAILLIGSAGLIAVKGFDYGIDFAGGTLVHIRAENTTLDLNQIRSELNDRGYNSVTLQSAGGDKDELIIRIPTLDQPLNITKSQVSDALHSSIGGDNYELLQSSQVGPRVGDALKKQALLATLYALLGILIYVTIRFEVLYAFGAIVTLAHDIIILMGFYSLSSLEINLTVVAAVLTVVGYSLNDTIIILDRVREMKVKFATENLDSDTPMDVKAVMNNAINSTLNRTILTSFTTLMASGVILILGGPALRGFSAGITIGVAIGTYSSIAVSCGVIYHFSKKYGSKIVDKTNKKHTDVEEHADGARI